MSTSFPDFENRSPILPEDFVVKEVVYFLCRPNIADVIPQFEEIQGAKWFNFNEALNQLTYQKDRNILQLAEAFINRIK